MDRRRLSRAVRNREVRFAVVGTRDCGGKGDEMHSRRVAVALSLVGVVAVLAGASGGVAQARSSQEGSPSAGPDISTPEAATAYLISRGYDPSTFVFQVGLKNYAGPSCPGLDWNCTGAARVVQIASAGGMNYAACAEDVRQCLIVQGSSAGLATPLKASGEDDVNMHGRCTPPPEGANLRLRDSGELACLIAQANPTTGNNHAVASMSIHDNDGPTQFGQMDAIVTQTTHGDGDNHAVVHEEIVLGTHDETTGTQKQDGYQSLHLTQDVAPLVDDTDVIPATGDNFADVKETQKITAHARLDGSVQLQQTTERPGSDPCPARPTDTNSCIEFHQTTGTGRNTVIAHMDHDVAATAAGEGAEQTQGCTTKQCGLELDGTQEGPGSTNRVDNNQTIHDTLNGPDGTTQIQDRLALNGPGLQAGGPNDIWEVDQRAVLTASDPEALQGQINVVDDSSTGTVDAKSVTIIDGDRSEIVCSASSCNYAQVCGQFAVEPGFAPFCPDFADVSISP
jgi:hypothetical protein